MKKLNSRCPLQSECERVCKCERHELDCDYYDANARKGLQIPDQEDIREKRFTDHEYELDEKNKEVDSEYKCGSCSIGHWYSGEHEYVSVVTPSGGTEKRPCQAHTHYCYYFEEGQRKIDGEADFDPEDAPGWCPRWEEDRLKESAGLGKSLISLKEKPAPEMKPAAERDIRTVTMEIRTLHRQSQMIVLGYAIEIGRRLVEAKSLLKHGEWGVWLRNEVEFSQSTAENLMIIFEDYGARQMGLFGPEANSQTLGNLPYTKALKLLALPAEEREEFVKTNDVEELSTRELDKLIRERDEALKRAEKAEELAETRGDDLVATDSDLRMTEVELEDARKKAAEANEKAAQLENELKELKNRPVEVAVQTDEKAVEKARKEARAAAEKELKAKIADAEKKLKEARDEAAQAKKTMEEAVASAKRENGREAEEARAKAEALEKQLKVAGSPAVAEFKVHFEGAQREIGAMADCLRRIWEAGDEERYHKLSRAMEALADYISNIEPASESGEQDA